MTPKQRLRRVAILCCHCLRNIALYRAWPDCGRPYINNQFWRTTNNNFIDIAVLEWCKLFADLKGKHHWHRVVSDEGRFLSGLLQALSFTENDLDEYVREMKVYRDKFVAHLDELETMQIPYLENARKSAAYLYDHLRTDAGYGSFFYDAPESAETFYVEHSQNGKRVYSQ